MQEPELSIIIPHYENTDGLEILLHSIYSDSIEYPEIGFEVLVIDDYSCNQTKEELIKLKSKYDFKLFHNDSIKSAGTCRNIGIENSKGRWILFADSDDYFLPDFLKSVSDYFDSDYDIVFFPPISRIYKTNEESDRHKFYIDLLEIYYKKKDQNVLRTRWSPPWSKLINKNLIVHNNIRFDSIIARNDAYFSLYAGLKANKICVDKKTIYCVNDRVNSLSQINTVEFVFSRLKSRIKTNKLLSLYNLQKYKFNYIPYLKMIANINFYQFLKALGYILINGENPFMNFSFYLHSYLKEKNYGKGGKPLKSMIISIFNKIKISKKS